jgi:hypothetical protein
MRKEEGWRYHKTGWTALLATEKAKHAIEKIMAKTTASRSEQFFKLFVDTLAMFGTSQ